MMETQYSIYAYSYYNRSLKEFHNPIFSDVPPVAFAAAVKKAVILKPEKALEQGLNRCRLFQIGYFNEENGSLVPLDENIELLDILEVYTDATKGSEGN